jgi:hypothetical protein
LKHTQFSGGEKTVASKLEELGFIVYRAPQPIRETLRSLGPQDVLPTADAVELEERVKRLRREGFIDMPPGQREPERVEKHGSEFKRDPQVIA